MLMGYVSFQDLNSKPWGYKIRYFVYKQDQVNVILNQVLGSNSIEHATMFELIPRGRVLNLSSVLDTQQY